MKAGLDSIMQNKKITAILSIVAGVIFIFMRRFALTTLVSVVGIIMLIGCAVFAVQYFMSKVRDNAQLPGLIAGVIVGLIFATAPGFIVDLFPLIFGILLILSGVTNLMQALSLPGSSEGRTMLIVFAALTFLLGGFIVFHPGFIADVVVVFMGITMVANGITDLMAARTVR